jgi:hypothetical protein
MLSCCHHFSNLTSESSARLRRDSAFLSEYSKALVERSKMRKLLDLKKTNNELRQLTKQRRLGGERLTAAAAVLLLTPDPVTSAASIPMFAIAQLMKSKKKASDLSKVFETANSELKSLSTFSQMIR